MPISNKEHHNKAHASAREINMRHDSLYKMWFQRKDR